MRKKRWLEPIEPIFSIITRGNILTESPFDNGEIRFFMPGLSFASGRKPRNRVKVFSKIRPSVQGYHFDMKIIYAI
jgi:hypothetical protein